MNKTHSVYTLFASCALIALSATGCDGNDTEDSQARSGLLPVTFADADGGDFLGGTYDPSTGEIHLTQVVTKGLVESVGDTDYEIVFANEDEAFGSVDLDLALGHVALDLGAGEELRLLGASDEMAVSVGAATIRGASWTQGVLESDAETSFANCVDAEPVRVFLL